MQAVKLSLPEAPHRVATWKAVPLFALMGGVTGSVLLMVGALQGEATPLFLVLFVSSLLPWAPAGALYAYLANKSGLDVRKPGTWLYAGIKSGTIIMLITSLIGLLLASHWLYQTRPAAQFWLTLLVSFCGITFAGALQGGITGLVVGRLVTEATRKIPID